MPSAWGPSGAAGARCGQSLRARRLSCSAITAAECIGKGWVIEVALAEWESIIC